MDETPTTPDAPQDDGLTVRERRAQHAKSQARKQAPGKMLRKAIVPAIIILVIAGISAGFYFTAKNQGDCPGHWHATFDVYVQQSDGTTDRMEFRHPAFDLNGQTPFRSHMHQADNKNQFHFEQGGQCVGVQEAFSYVDVDVRATSLTFDGAHSALGQAGTYRVNDTRSLDAYIESADGVWRHPSVRSILNYQLLDGERLLLTYGDFSPDEIAQFQAGVALPSSGRAV